jgi:hypothetical protein
MNVIAKSIQTPEIFTLLFGAMRTDFSAAT